MATQRYTGQPLKAGDWINCTSMMTNGLCGNPRLVVKASAASACFSQIAVPSLNNTGYDLDPPQRKNLTNVVFVSDTYAEALALKDASARFLQAETDHDAVYHRAKNMRRHEAIEAALAAANGEA